MKYYNDKLLYASEESTGYFFADALTPKINEEIKATCGRLGFTNYFVHAFRSSVEDEHFLKLDKRLF